MLWKKGMATFFLCQIPALTDFMGFILSDFMNKTGLILMGKSNETCCKSYQKKWLCKKCIFMKTTDVHEILPWTNTVLNKKDVEFSQYVLINLPLN